MPADISPADLSLPHARISGRAAPVASLRSALFGEAATAAYVVDNGGGAVSVIDTVTDVVAATIPVGDFPDGVAVAPTGGTVYVANAVDGTVSVIDTATKTVTFVIPGVGPHPSAIAIGASATSSAVTVTAEPNPAQVHHLVTLTATVTCSEGTPAGRVEFRDGATVLGSAGLRNGTATLVRHCEASTSPPVTVTVR